MAREDEYNQREEYNKMSDARKFEEFQLSWQLFAFGGAEGIVRGYLTRLWNYFLGEGSFDRRHFGELFRHYSEALHLLGVLELKPIADPRKKKLRLLLIDETMEAKATHDVLYDHRKDQMVAWLKEDCEERIRHFENIEETIGKSLNVPDDSQFTGDDHPIHELLDLREEIGWILLGIRNQQAEDKYVTVDLPAYTRRMKIADLTLEKLVIISVTYHYPEFRETRPYAPPDFWWSYMKNHECLTPKENWAEGILSYSGISEEDED